MVGLNGALYMVIPAVLTGAELPTVFLAITDIVYVCPKVSPCEIVNGYVFADVYFTAVFE
jgi:hypothetical protein